jgi:predicted metal-dependent hydrolase
MAQVRLQIEALAGSQSQQTARTIFLAPGKNAVRNVWHSDGVFFRSHWAGNCSSYPGCCASYSKAASHFIAKRSGGRQKRFYRLAQTKRIVRREFLKIDGQAVELNVKLNPRARRLIVKVHPASGEVMVIAPTKRALDRAVEFARGESDWIARQLAKVPARIVLAPGAHVPFQGIDHLIVRAERGPVTACEAERVLRVSGRAEHAPRRMLDFFKKQARQALEQKCVVFAARLGLKPSRITVRDTASRWGSCSSTRALSFSWRLILAPAFVLDYVVAHEVAHLKEMNHGPHFWQLVAELIGDAGPAQAWLNQHGTALHRYAPR